MGWKVFDNERRMYVLDDQIRADSHQIKGNSCWANSMQVLIRSRATAANGLAKISEAQILKESYVNGGYGNLGAEKSNINEAHEMILDHVPDTSVHGQNYRLLPNHPYTKEEILTIRQHLQETLLHALRDHQSPIAFTNGFHFRTIVGIGFSKEGRAQFLVRDPAQAPTHTETWHLSDFLRMMNDRGIQFSWLQDEKVPHLEEFNEQIDDPAFNRDPRIVEILRFHFDSRNKTLRKKQESLQSRVDLLQEGIRSVQEQDDAAMASFLQQAQAVFTELEEERLELLSEKNDFRYRLQRADSKELKGLAGANDKKLPLLTREQAELEQRYQDQVKLCNTWKQKLTEAQNIDLAGLAELVTLLRKEQVTLGLPMEQARKIDPVNLQKEVNKTDRKKADGGEKAGKPESGQKEDPEKKETSDKKETSGKKTEKVEVLSTDEFKARVAGQDQKTTAKQEEENHSAKQPEEEPVQKLMKQQLGEEQTAPLNDEQVRTLLQTAARWKRYEERGGNLRQSHRTDLLIYLMASDRLDTVQQLAQFGEDQIEEARAFLVKEHYGKVEFNCNKALPDILTRAEKALEQPEKTEKQPEKTEKQPEKTEKQAEKTEKQPEKTEKQTEGSTAGQTIDFQDPAPLTAMIQELKHEKRFWHNSDEYTALIKAAEKFRDHLTDGPRPNKILTRSLLGCITDYYQHKGSDGIKVTSERKLMAVEKLTSYLIDMNDRMGIIPAYDDYNRNLRGIYRDMQDPEDRRAGKQRQDYQLLTAAYERIKSTAEAAATAGRKLNRPRYDIYDDINARLDKIGVYGPAGEEKRNTLRDILQVLDRETASGRKAHSSMKDLIKYTGQLRNLYTVTPTTEEGVRAFEKECGEMAGKLDRTLDQAKKHLPEGGSQSLRKATMDLGDFLKENFAKELSTGKKETPTRKK